jgi:nucleotidyltransferase/DNA polymerase involved in DNA repair
MYRGRLIPSNFFDSAEAGAISHKRWISQPRETGTRYTCEPAARESANAAVPVVTSSTWGGEKRIACVLVGDFAVAAIARANPELRDRPFALIRMPAARSPMSSGGLVSKPAIGGLLRKPAAYQPHSELSDVSPSARAAGVRPAMTVAQARALIPDLIVTRPSSAAERSAADALLDVAESMSPVAEEGTPGCVWLDLTGVERLYRYSMGAEGSADDVENSIAEELIRRARRIGLEAAAGIGSNKEIAHLAARCGGARVIATGMEREFLDWLPLDLLELDPNGQGDEVELMLKRLGIRRLGDIARLESRALGSRLGRRGVQLARLARGEGSATVIARPRGETFAEAAEFEYGIENLEPLGFVLHAMLKQLTERLQIRGLAAGDLTLSLGLADRRYDSRHVPVAAATTEARSLLTLLKLHLEKSPPPAAVETVRLTVEARARRPAQIDLFLPAAPAPDRIEAAIARIAALCGPECVGTLVPADSYRPEAVRLSKFTPPPPESAERRLSQHERTPAAMASDSTAIVLRAIRPAEEVEVMWTRNSPEFVRGNNICAQVVSSAGPWRRQGEWWAAAQISEDSASYALRNNSPAAYNRDYYELALADGAVYRIYCDLSTGKWFADGIYD